MMSIFRLIRIEYNIWNGLLIEILNFNERSLFSINAASNFVVMDILFMTIPLYDPQRLFK